jgi:hypothetical protein
MELDHIFVIAPVGLAQTSCVTNANQLLGTASSAHAFSQQLSTLGFSEGSSNRHPGQGTANHRFFFDGFMLEFLFVDDLVGLSDKRAKQLGLLNRFSDTSCSPFGIASRRSCAAMSDANYAFGIYKPHYLPPHLQIQVAKGPLDSEPLWFHLPFVGGSTEQDRPADKEARVHANKAFRLTSLVIEMPFEASAASTDIADKLNIKLNVGERHAAHMVFDEGRQGIQLSVSDSMPLTISI